ncbi:MAG: amidase domain-containing protein [Lawsonibacter sp.]|nr:amidase domain-containing protein [Lawsonibacter sp.]
MTLYPYDRQSAVDYAHRWAYHRNPRFYNFDELGGDCTNFASQCLYAGSGVMNYTPTFGWYYITVNNRAPAWTGVRFFYDFLTRGKENPGPVGQEASIDQVNPGDFVQISFANDVFRHNPVIVAIEGTPSLENILVAAHSDDADYRPLSTYPAQSLRFIHILGVYR